MVCEGLLFWVETLLLCLSPQSFRVLLWDGITFSSLHGPEINLQRDCRHNNTITHPIKRNIYPIKLNIYPIILNIYPIILNIYPILLNIYPIILNIYPIILNI